MKTLILHTARNLFEFLPQRDLLQPMDDLETRVAQLEKLLDGAAEVTVKNVPPSCQRQGSRPLSHIV
jgi:hypothetical protein